MYVFIPPLLFTHPSIHRRVCIHPSAPIHSSLHPPLCMYSSLHPYSLIPPRTAEEEKRISIPPSPSEARVHTCVQHRTEWRSLCSSLAGGRGRGQGRRFWNRSRCTTIRNVRRVICRCGRGLWGSGVSLLLLCSVYTGERASAAQHRTAQPFPITKVYLLFSLPKN